MTRPPALVRPAPFRRSAAALAAGLALALALAAPAWAESGGAPKPEGKTEKKNDKLAPPAKGERYARLPTIVLELWDRAGTYHYSTIDLILQVPEEAKFSEKKVSDAIKRMLNTIPFEEYAQANPAPMIKAMVLERVRQEPGCEMARDVLISKMLFR